MSRTMNKRCCNNCGITDATNQLLTLKRTCVCIHGRQSLNNRFITRRFLRLQQQLLSHMILFLLLTSFQVATGFTILQRPSSTWGVQTSLKVLTNNALYVRRYGVNARRNNSPTVATVTTLKNSNSDNNDRNDDDQQQQQSNHALNINGSSSSIMDSNSFSHSSIPIGGVAGAAAIATTTSNTQQQEITSVVCNSDSSSIDSTLKSSSNPPFLVTLDDGSQHSYTEAIQRTVAWVTAAIIFGSTLWITNNAQTGEEFFAGYLVEQSLSVDNLFVFLLLFEYFEVPLQYQDRVLNWGIYGAIVMRAIMIGLGAAALQQFHAILLVFAAILVYSSVSFFIKNESDADDEDPSKNAIVNLSRSLFPSTDKYDGDRFFTVVDGIRMATPLFICMIAVEISDVVFAVDSIPAVFGVTENPLIVFSSNIFAIMGLRSLYTILSKAATDLKYLEPAVAIVLGFIGSKMIAEYLDVIIPTNIALAVVATVLSSGIGLSVWEKQREEQVGTNKK